MPKVIKVWAAIFFLVNMWSNAHAQVMRDGNVIRVEGSGTTITAQATTSIVGIKVPLPQAGATYWLTPRTGQTSTTRFWEARFSATNPNHSDESVNLVLDGRGWTFGTDAVTSSAVLLLTIR
jgi:hypothetical protein